MTAPGPRGTAARFAVEMPPDAQGKARIFIGSTGGEALRGFGSSRKEWPGGGGTDWLVFWIPGAPASPNNRGATTRQRMSRTKAERDKAYLLALAARNATKWDEHAARPTRVLFRVYRRRLLDPMVNLPASLKATQDGVCRALLPLGDGPRAPYRWLPVEQIAVTKASQEGVFVAIERQGTRSKRTSVTVEPLRPGRTTAAEGGA